MLAAFNVGVRQFVHQYHMRLARENRIHIHLLEDGRFIFQLLAWNCFQPRREFYDRLAPMRLHHSDYDFFPAAGASHALAQHGIGFSHARGITQEELEHCGPLLRVTFL
jgi:hypothetical protein